MCQQVPKYEVEYVEKVVEVQSQVAQEHPAGGDHYTNSQLDIKFTIGY